jgi:G3E family GTPase
MDSAQRTPVTVLTGYLGSGKTTLLQRLLKSEVGSRAAVLINEFGEASLDHLLVRPVIGNTVVLRNGCVCCSMRSELREELRALLDSRDKGELPPFDRILIETSGLADPVPLVQTFVADPMLRHQLRLANLVATVDTMNGLEQLADQPEAERQVATADRLVLTKTDLCNPASIAKLRQRLIKLNPHVPVTNSAEVDALWPTLLEGGTGDSKSAAREVRIWFGGADGVITTDANGVSGPLSHIHGAGVHSFVMRTHQRIDWSAFAVWLSALVHRHGHGILRLKGLLDVPGAEGPVCLNAVQHFIHPPVHLDGWPDGDHTSRLVFIVQDLSEHAIRASLERVLSYGRTVSGGEREVV